MTTLEQIQSDGDGDYIFGDGTCGDTHGDGWGDGWGTGGGRIFGDGTCGDTHGDGTGTSHFYNKGWALL